MKEFEAIEENGEIKVKAIVEKKPNGDVTVHLPSIPLIQELKTKFKEEKDGKRSIQPIQSKPNE